MDPKYSNFVNGILNTTGAVTVTSPFGPRTWKNTAGVMVKDVHKGIDMVPATFVRTPARGKVILIYKTTAAGNIVEIEHGGGYVTAYKHLADGSITTVVNTILERFIQFAKAGATGSYINGAHIHYEVKLNGVPQDPLPYLLGTKTIPPYVEPVLPAKELVFKSETPVLKIIESSNVRDAGGVKALDIGNTVVGQSYAYLGHTKDVDGYKWARIDFNGVIGYCALNTAWNTVVNPVVIPPSFEAEVQKDGLVLNVSLKPVVK